MLQLGHINMGSPAADLVILPNCFATSLFIAMMLSCLIAIMLSQVAWYHASSKAVSSHMTDSGRLKNVSDCLIQASNRPKWEE